MCFLSQTWERRSASEINAYHISVLEINWIHGNGCSDQRQRHQSSSSLRVFDWHVQCEQEAGQRPVSDALRLALAPDALHGSATQG